jgi:hypothetical protein
MCVSQTITSQLAHSYCQLESKRASHCLVSSTFGYHQHLNTSIALCTLATRHTTAKMASDEVLNTGTKDHNARLPPSEASNSAASVPGNKPSRTTSPPTSASSLPTLPISELVLDLDTILQPPESGPLHASKHNPDFRVRNYSKWLKISTILSEFHTLLQAAQLSEDQSAFDCLHAHILKAGEDLDSFTQQQSALVAYADDEDPRFQHEDLGKSVVPGRENEWYMVQHDAPEDDGAERDALATKRLLCARKAYEATLDEGSSDSESDGGASVSEEQDSDDEDTTLVEDSPEGFAEELRPVSSMTLDGSHDQAGPDSVVADYPDYYLETLHYAADFLETIQTVNKATMAAYGITLDGLEIAEDDETSMSEAAEELRFESAQPAIEVAEALRRDNEAVMATYGFSVDDLDVEVDESEVFMDE